MNATSTPTTGEQLTAARASVLLVASPLVDLEPLRVRGKDRVRWLNGMVTSDVAKLPVGGAQFGLHVGKTGKIVAELWIAHAESEIVVGVPRGRGRELQAALDRYLIMEECEIAVGDPDVAFLLAFGPGAAALVEGARGEGLGGAAGARRGGMAVGVVFGEPDSIRAFEAASVASGAAVAATSEGWEIVRIEHGIGLFGVDFDGTAYPQEAALEVDGVSFSKGCYLGQEAVFMMQERGHPPRRLVKLALDSAHSVAPGTVVVADDGSEIGKVTSSQPRREGGSASGAVLATLKWKFARGELPISVDGRPAAIGGAS